ncbi:MAG: PEP-CTERM sorting domain-containing protein [bacterium]
MLKRMSILITMCLFVIVSARIATAVPLDNGISKFDLDNVGRVTGAYLSSDPTDNFLAGGELNFGIMCEIPSITSTLWLENLGMSLIAHGSDWATFNGSYGFGPGKSMSIGAEFKLQAGKPYMDIRYSVGTNGVDIKNARVYFYLKPAVGSSLARLITPAQKAAWQMSQDAYNPFKSPASNWPTGDAFPDIFVAGNVAFAMKKGQDDYESGDATTIKNKMNAGLSLGDVVAQYPSNPAWGLRYPASIDILDILNTQTFFMDARLETAPEPSTICLMLTGLVGVVGAARRKFLR